MHLLRFLILLRASDLAAYCGSGHIIGDLADARCDISASDTAPASLVLSGMYLRREGLRCVFSGFNVSAGAAFKNKVVYASLWVDFRAYSGCDGFEFRVLESVLGVVENVTVYWRLVGSNLQPRRQAVRLLGGLVGGVLELLVDGRAVSDAYGWTGVFRTPTPQGPIGKQIFVALPCVFPLGFSTPAGFWAALGAFPEYAHRNTPCLNGNSCLPWQALQNIEKHTKSCPEGHENINGQCRKCTAFWVRGSARCAEKCPPGTAEQNWVCETLGSDTCLVAVYQPGSGRFLCAVSTAGCAFLTQNICYTACPDEYWLSEDSLQCYEECPAGSYTSLQERRCLTRCQTSFQLDGTFYCLDCATKRAIFSPNTAQDSLQCIGPGDACEVHARIRDFALCAPLNCSEMAATAAEMGFAWPGPWTRKDTGECLAWCPAGSFTHEEKLICGPGCDGLAAFLRPSGENGVFPRPFFSCKACYTTLYYLDGVEYLCSPCVSGAVSSHQILSTSPSFDANLCGYGECGFGLVFSPSLWKCVPACGAGECLMARGGKRCVALTDQVGFFYTDEGVKVCTELCPPSGLHVASPAAGVAGVPQCVSACPKGEEFVLQVAHERKCTQKCSGPWALRNGVPHCISGAVCPQASLRDECLPECPPEAPYVGNDGECLKNAAYVVVSATGAKRALDTCPGVHHAMADGLCLRDCPDELFSFAGRCVKGCPPDYEVYNGECATAELPWPILEFEECAGPYLAGKCVHGCPWPLVQKDALCAEACPLDWSLQGEQCVLECSGFVDGGECLFDCPGRLYSVANGVRMCETGCVPGEFTFGESQVCTVFRVPKHSFPAYVQPKEGVWPHPGPPCWDYVDRGLCVSQCAPGQFILHWNTCVDACPSAAADGVFCVAQCPQERPVNRAGFCSEQCEYHLSIEGTCLDSCADSDYTLGAMCAASCPEPHGYKDKSRCQHACEFGYVIGNECVSINKCSAVALGSMPWAEECVESCREEDVVFRTESRSYCFSRCPPHLWLEENARQCVQACRKGTSPSGGLCQVYKKTSFALEYTAVVAGVLLFLGGVAVLGIACYVLCPESTREYKLRLDEMKAEARQGDE